MSESGIPVAREGGSRTLAELEALSIKRASEAVALKASEEAAIAAANAAAAEAAAAEAAELQAAAPSVSEDPTLDDGEV
jgi:hypothetical protein